MKLDIAFALNQNIVVGLLAAMNSVVQNSSNPQELRFNIAVPPDEEQFFETKIQDFFPDAVFTWRVCSFIPPQFIKNYIHAKFEPMTENRRASRYMQYARLFLNEIFADITKVLYLDADVVVLGDVATLFDAVEFTPSQYFAAVPHLYPAILHFHNPLKAIAEIRSFRQTFNSGVLFTDYTYWDEKIDKILRYYLDWDGSFDYKMFDRGDETLLNLMFKDYIQLDKSWNCCGFGNFRFVGWFLRKNLQDINVIHWSGGHHKPWKTENIAYGDIWRYYASPITEASKKSFSKSSF